MEKSVNKLKFDYNYFMSERCYSILETSRILGVTRDEIITILLRHNVIDEHYMTKKNFHDMIKTRLVNYNGKMHRILYIGDNLLERLKKWV